MNFGKVDIGLGDKDRYSHNTSQLESDVARLALLLFMLGAAIIGSVVASRANRPASVVRHAVEKTRARAHKVSLEGTVMVGTERRAMYRMRQDYDPAQGLTLTETAGTDTDPPFDSLTALDLVLKAGNYIEHPHEDMYHRATRHFSGSLPNPNGDGSVAYAFNCWVDIKKRHLVRIDIAGVRRNAGATPSGAPISEETYLNFRYYGYRD